MFYKKRFIRNTSLIPEKIKKRGLVLLEKLRNAFFALSDSSSHHFDGVFISNP